MKPEDKARELTNKFYQLIPINLPEAARHNNAALWEHAKQCAIIAVEEILAVNHGNAWSHIPGRTIKEYYTEVLTHLKAYSTIVP